jgi:hypothetical protein
MAHGLTESNAGAEAYGRLGSSFIRMRSAISRSGRPLEDDGVTARNRAVDPGFRAAGRRDEMLVLLGFFSLWPNANRPAREGTSLIVVDSNYPYIPL